MRGSPKKHGARIQRRRAWEMSRRAIVPQPCNPRTSLARSSVQHGSVKRTRARARIALPTLHFLIGATMKTPLAFTSRAPARAVHAVRLRLDRAVSQRGHSRERDHSAAAARGPGADVGAALGDSPDHALVRGPRARGTAKSASAKRSARSCATVWSRSVRWSSCKAPAST